MDLITKISFMLSPFFNLSFIFHVKCKMLNYTTSALFLLSYNQLQVLFYQNLIISQYLDMHHTSSTITLYQLQNIFPTLILPKLENSQLSFLDSLDAITSNLPVPEAQNFSSTLSTMQKIMDQQEYKYQRSILKQQKEDEMIIFDEECSYQQGSTGIMCTKDIICTQYEDKKSNFVDAIWNWKGANHSQQAKQQYFCFFY